MKKLFFTVALLFFILPVYASKPLPPEPTPPLPVTGDTAFIVAKVNEDGYASFSYSFDLINKGGEDKTTVTMLLPYSANDVKVYFTRQQGWKIFEKEVYVDEKGNIHEIKTFDDARENAGLADFSAVDAEEKAVNGLVYAVIKYPYNQTKNELVYASVYKDYALRYGGWDRLPMMLQQSLSINIKKATQEEKRYIDEDIPFDVTESYGQAILLLNLPQPISPMETSKIMVRYKVEEEVTVENLRGNVFTVAFALPSNTFNAVISVVPPEHDVFKFTKPELDLARINGPYYRDYLSEVKTFSSRPMSQAQSAPLVTEASRAEKEFLKEQADKQTYFLRGKAYRLMLFDITPEEKFQVQAMYSSKERYYAPNIIALVIVLGALSILQKRRSSARKARGGA